jgi:hypothetical protein
LVVELVEDSEVGAHLLHLEGGVVVEVVLLLDLITLLLQEHIRL